MFTTPSTTFTEPVARLALAGSLAWGLLALSVALAEDAAEPGDPPLALDTVTVIAGKSERAMRDVPATVTLIDAEQIQETLTRDIKTLVRYEPGVTVGNDPNRFGFSGFSIRGIDGNRVSIEVDGVPVPDGFAIGSFSHAGRDFVDPDLLKKVEILRGPASTLYGSDALGGVVTFTTRDPSDLLTGRPDGRYFALKSAYYGADESFQGTITTALGSKRVSALVAYTQRDGEETDNRSQEAMSAPNPSDVRAESVLVKVNHGPTDLGLVFEQRNADRFTDVRSFVGGPGRFASTTRLEGDDRHDRTRLSLDQTLGLRSVFADAATWRVFHQNAETAQDTLQDRAAGGRTPDPTRRVRVFELRQESIGGELTLEKTLGGSGAQHALVYGVEATGTRWEEMRDGVEINLTDGSRTNTIIGEEFPVRDFPISEDMELGLYFQDEITFGSGRLTLIPGIRYEYYDLDPEPDAVFLEDNPGLAVAGITESNLSPKLGLLFEVNEHWSVVSQYSRGFRSPPMEDVNIGLTIPLFGYVALPNPDLQPETSEGIEAGLRFESAMYDMTVSMYYNEYRDLIESRVNLGVDPATGYLTFQSLNRDRATISGLEYRGHFRLGARYPALDGLTFSSGVAYARGRDETRNEPLNSVEPLTAVLGLQYQPPQRAWSLELMARLVAGKDEVDQTAGPLFEPPGYGVLDILARYELTRHLTLNAGIFNLADKRYWEWSDVRGLPADDPLIDFYTQPGRHFAVSLRFAR